MLLLDVTTFHAYQQQFLLNNLIYDVRGHSEMHVACHMWIILDVCNEYL